MQTKKDLSFYIAALKEKYTGVQLWKITKISKNTDAEIRPDYWVLGELQLDYYKAGGKIYVWRLANSDHPEGRQGEFTSSPIQTIEHYDTHDIVHTFNSTYRVEKI